jgi:nucleotide-binding universal stress UspA family protein
VGLERRILVAVDGSGASREAARLAFEMAPKLDARVTFLHVVPHAADPSEPDGAALFGHVYEGYARELVRRVCEMDALAGARADACLLRGDPAQAIAHAAEAADVELVIVGTRGRGPVARTLFGSVSDALVRCCPKPVMVVHEESAPAAHG